MDPMIKERVLKELRCVLDAHRQEIRQLVREAVAPELQRIIREEIHRELGAAPAAEVVPAPVEDPPQVAPPSEPLPVAVAPEEPAADEEPSSPPAPGEGRYVYGVVRGEKDLVFGPMGIDGEEVRIIWEEGLGAVVHDCAATPYESADEETVKQWLLAHQGVIDRAWREFGVVIPTSFDTILAGDKGRGADETVAAWLRDGREDFMVMLERFSGQAEYGVQVFWDAPAMMETLARESDSVREMTATLQDKPKGAAYLHRQKIESLLKKELETKADHYFRAFFKDIKGCVTEVKIEKTKKAEDPARQMIMNLACLLPREESGALGRELERINEMAWFFVKFTGPWPPYSFT